MTQEYIKELLAGQHAMDSAEFEFSEGLSGENRLRGSYVLYLVT